MRWKYAWNEIYKDTIVPAGQAPNLFKYRMKIHMKYLMSTICKSNSGNGGRVGYLSWICRHSVC